MQRKWLMISFNIFIILKILLSRRRDLIWYVIWVASFNIIISSNYIFFEASACPRRTTLHILLFFVLSLICDISSSNATHCCPSWAHIYAHIFLRKSFDDVDLSKTWSVLSSDQLICSSLLKKNPSDSFCKQ